MRSRFLIVTMLAASAVVAACSSSGASTPASQAPAVTQAPASQAPASQAPASQAPASAAAGAVSVDAKPVGTLGTVLVAGSNGMTVYVFSKDVKDSGKSACTGGCLATWPALTVPAGATPTGGSSVTGKLGTITRDDGALQVTYNGLPLYFFKNDKAPGDSNGVYQDWEAVKP